MVVVVVAVALTVDAVVVVVAKGLVVTGGVIDTPAAPLTIDALINAVNAVAVNLGFAVPGSCSVDVLSDVAVDLFMDTLADAMLGVLTGIDIEVLADANANAFAVVTTLEFPAV